MPVPKPRFSKRHLPRRLRVLIGTWTIEGSFVGGEKEQHVRGTATFRWLVKDVLAVWRTRMAPAPPSGRIAPNGRSIRTLWETSADGRRWRPDFILTYTKR